VPQESIRRLSLADLDEERLRQLIDHGEDLFVERKQQPPERSGLGAAVASFANTLGGWLLLGVRDDGTIEGYAEDARTDVQSHFGQVLANQVDPLPPFVADVREVDGKPVTILRVFESADTPRR
jgi:predicted HTH transcriptional regulator